jgi:hypothetical protein
VIGDIAAAARLVDFDAPGSQRFRRDENMRSAAVAADTERQDGGVLDEQQHIVDSIDPPLFNEGPLQSQGFGVRDDAEPADFEEAHRGIG